MEHLIDALNAILEETRFNFSSRTRCSRSRGIGFWRIVSFPLRAGDATDTATWSLACRMVLLMQLQSSSEAC